MKSNKKRILFVLAILTMAILLSFVFVACNKTDTPDAPKKEFTITFDTRGGSEVKPITIAEGTTITLPHNPTKEGYIFDGWYLSDEFIEKFNATQTISSNITVYAKWKEDGNQDEKQSYTITFDTQGGSEVKSITIAEGETITLPSNPTKEGYVFDGWYLSEEFIEKFNATQTISSNITVYAKWKEDGNQDEKQTYTVTFDTQGGSEVKSLVLKEGETIPLPSNPTKEGYVFDGWYLDSSYTQAFDSTKRIDSNMVLYAKWKILDDGQSIIASDYFDINGLVLTMNKQKYITSSEDVFDLRNKFSTSNGSSWRAFTSPNCDQPTEITTRMANVSVGWNDIYVMVENLTTYENQIYRLKIYKYPTIVYRELNDGFLEIQSVSDCADVLFPDDKIDKITSIGENAFSSCPSLHTLEGLPKLINIGPSAFANCKRLTSITIPDSVTSIGDYAFNGCTGLTSIEVPNSVTTIPAYAFNGCTGLTSITIPDSVTSIGGYAFSGCTGLTSITIPDSVTSIGSSAFSGCTGLTSITVPENNSAYSSVDGILYDKNKTKIVHVPEAIKVATIPDSVTSIGEGTFRGCSSLESITIPFVGAKAGVASSDTYQYPFGYIFGTLRYTGGIATTQYYYGNSTSSMTSTTYYIPSSLKSVTVTGGNILAGAFYGCKGLTSITIPNSVTSIGDDAFYNCTGLTSVTIPDCVTSIGSSAFSGCIGLTSIEVPNSVTTIPAYAFDGCTGLTSIIIPDSVTSIGDSAFRGCYKLIEVYNKSTLSITAGSSSNGYVAYYAKNVYTNEGGSKLTTDENGYVIYTNGYAKILVAYTGIETELTLPSDITKIYQYAFSYCSGLTSVTIPDRVTSIGERAFYNCIGLTTVNWDATKCTSAGVYLYPIFSGCTNLKTVNIGENVKTIPANAFVGCTGLTSVTIGNGVTSIGNGAFVGCTGLTSVTIPNSVTSIGGSAFKGCIGLTSITIPDSVTSIGERAFDNTAWYNNQPNGLVYAGKVAYEYKGTMPSNTSIVLKEGTLGIADSAFRGCTELRSITIPDSVTSIGGSAFKGCTGLLHVTIGNSVKSIGSYAFSGCTELSSITIPDSVTSIADSAFRGCTELSSITIPDSVTSIDNYAFDGCTGLLHVTIGNSVKSIGFSAFDGCTELRSITIGSGVKSIGVYAFYECTGLTSITFNGTMAQWKAISKGKDWKHKVPNECKVICTDGTTYD